MFVETQDCGLVNLDQMSRVELNAMKDTYDGLNWVVIAIAHGHDYQASHTLFSGDVAECRLFLAAIIEALESGARVARFEQLNTSE
jgi:hypothetical protein